MPAGVRGSLQPTVHGEIMAAVCSSPKPAVYKVIQAAVCSSPNQPFTGKTRSPSATPSSPPQLPQARRPLLTPAQSTLQCQPLESALACLRLQSALQCRILDSAVQCPPLQGPFLWCPPLQSARLNQPLLPPINYFVGDSGAPAEEVGLEPRFRRQFRHSLPNIRIRHGHPSPRICHGRPRFPLHFGSQNGRHPGGLLSPVTMVKLWCSKTMVYLWSPWFNNRNPFFILKPWLIFVKEVYKLTVPQLQ